MSKLFPIMWTYKADELIAKARTDEGLTKLVIALPWDMIEPHEAQAMKNHGGQTLARLAERGGLSAAEALAVIRNQQRLRTTNVHAAALLLSYLEAWEIDQRKKQVA